LGSSVWTALVGLAVIPVYVRYLGIEGYALVGFLATAQAFVQILDFGLSASINREVARGSATGDLVDARCLLHTLAVIYWAAAGVIALTMVLLSPILAESWLRSGQFSVDSLSSALMLIGLTVACRWPGQLYQGALMGAQRIVVSSGLNVAFVTAASIGAVCVLAFVSKSVQAFFLWQAGVSLIFVLAARFAAWRLLPGPKIKFDRYQLKRIWRFSAGVAGITVSGIVLGQLDKLVLSKMVELTEYGQYMLASAIAAALYLFTAPLSNVLFPRFSALVHAADTARLADTYRLSTRLLGAIVFPAAMLLSVFPREIIHAFTGDSELAHSVSAFLPLLAIGTALHGIMHIPYALQLAYGMTRLPLLINAVLVLVISPLTVMLIWMYGAVGGATAWLALHALYFVLGTWITHRHLLKGTGLGWVTWEVGIPFGVSALVGLSAKYLPWGSDLPLNARLGYGAGLALLAVVLIFLISPHLRAIAVRWVREWRIWTH
jgi:O-antigen/teichoic acid export membrane protein